MEKIIPLLKEYVNRNYNKAHIQGDRKMSPKLLINPFSKDYEERRKVAHYFLFVASVIESKIVGRAENARRLLIHFHKTYGDDLFETSQVKIFKDEVRKCTFYDDLGSLKTKIPTILTSINNFVINKAEGDLIEYSLRFITPKDMVEEIAGNVDRMGGSFEDKSWLYMRWMVRPYHDLRIFEHFSSKDLYVPLTRAIANIAVSLGLIERDESSLWEDEQRLTMARDKVTLFARELFQNDPARVDYPFYLLGRWIHGKDLNINTLSEALRLFDYLYKITGHAHVFYQTMSRYKSGWEKWMKFTLTKMKVSFVYEGQKFPLCGNIFYTPDFILDATVHGKRILLEPHGLMKRNDVCKFFLFRQIYGNEYFLVLLMRKNDIPYYHKCNLLPEETYDDVWPIEDHPILVDKIRKGTYERSVSH